MVLRPLVSPRFGAFLILTALLIWTEVMVTHTRAFSQHPAVLSVGVLCDLVFVTSGIFYWIVARPLRLATNRTVLITLLMLRLALVIVPQSSGLPNQLWPFLLAISEGVVLIVAGVRIRTITRMYRQLRPSADAETALRGGLATVFGEKATGVILGEGLTLYYVLLGWRLQSDIPAGGQVVTSHRESGQVALTTGLVLVGVIEGVAVHLLLARWNPAIAFWVTMLSMYGMLFFVADIIATLKRPSFLTTDHLHLRLGVRWQRQIPRSAIADATFIHEKPARQSDRLNGAFLTAPNVLLTFTRPIEINGPYGLQKKVRQVAFFVDDRAAFVQVLNG
ncbi:hypothetical protein [Spirosoma endophyticum]|uniref:Uncharacterized protein n=1 Tax=Spirosoma endophyticum TaxID=662367 RepID=A0A1I1WUC1_9BACT|nr:hypothetical protein [Spirosoma endophyticum]SFD98795.1 hypothetical protein SAMN05216167_10977 [Spirosoma endophyticum]